MLVITRKCGEAFYIGNDIKIFLVEVKGKQVRIGIEAPKTISILREEHINGKASKGGAARKDSKRSPEG